MKSRETRVQVANITQLAQHFDCSREQVAKLEKQAIITRLPDGSGFNLDDSRRRYIHHLRERKPAGGRSRERYEAARAQREQMRAALMAGELCRTSDFGEAIDDVFGFLIPRLDGLPGRITRDLDLRKKWNEEIRQLRTEVADYCKKRANELGSGEAAA